MYRLDHIDFYSKLGIDMNMYLEYKLDGSLYIIIGFACVVIKHCVWFVLLGSEQKQL